MLHIFTGTRLYKSIYLRVQTVPITSYYENVSIIVCPKLYGGLPIYVRKRGHRLLWNLKLFLSDPVESIATAANQQMSITSYI